MAPLLRHSLLLLLVITDRSFSWGMIWSTRNVGVCKQLCAHGLKSLLFLFLFCREQLSFGPELFLFQTFLLLLRGFFCILVSFPLRFSLFLCFYPGFFSSSCCCICSSGFVAETQVLLHLENCGGNFWSVAQIRDVPFLFFLFLRFFLKLLQLIFFSISELVSARLPCLKLRELFFPHASLAVRF